MIAAHRIIKAQDVGPRTEPPSGIPEPGHRLSQQWLHHIGMKLPGQFCTGQDWITHGTSFYLRELAVDDGRDLRWQ